MKYLIFATMVLSLNGCSFVTAEKVVEEAIDVMEDKMAKKIADKVVDRLESRPNLEIHK